MTGTWVQVCVLLLGLGLTEGTPGSMYYYRTDRCVFNSTEANKSQYILSFYYNKLEFLRFDSDVGRFQGFTEIGVNESDTWNRNHTKLKIMREAKYKICEPQIKPFYSNILSKSVRPYAVLNTAPSAGSERVLVCSVYGFYPKEITVSWTNHHQPIKTGVITTDLLPDSDWYYQVHSRLNYSPRPGDQISCVVKHRSLDKPLVLDWGGDLSVDDRNKVIIAAVCLFVGLVLSLAGFIYYKRKSQGWTLIQNS